MKRSEMMVQLVQLLALCKVNELIYPETAEQILSLIEDRGMLPPTRLANNWKELGINTEEDELPRFKVNKWEQE